MSGINWGLLQTPDIAGNALAAFDKGREMKRAETSRNALATLVQNPDDQAAFGQLAQADPETAMGWQKQRAGQQADQQRKQQGQIPIMGKLLTYAKQGPQQWAQALQQAQAMGLDVSQVPQQFQPEWAEERLGFINAMGTPEGREALSTYGKIGVDRGLRPGTPEFAQFVTQAWQADQVKTIPYTAGGGVAGYNTATNNIQTIIAPNTGGQAAGTPVGGGDIPRLTSPDEAMRLPPGSRFYDPNGVLRTVPGGPQVAPAAGFHP